MSYFKRAILKILQLIPRSVILEHIGYEYISPNDKFNLEGHNEKLFAGHLLDSNSTVVVLGGYTGNSVNEWSTRYNARVITYEPVPHYYEGLKKRFATRNDISIFDYAAGGSEKDIEIGFDSENSGEFSPSTNKMFVKMIDIAEHLNQLGIHEIDLIEINIEGGEYDVLERLLRKKHSLRVKNLLIQFHNLLPEHPLERESYRSLLRQNYTQEWNYEWVWEFWKETRLSGRVMHG